MKRRIKVHIADDHPVVVEGLKALIRRTAPDIAITGAAADGRAALELARRSPADIYVYDISMPAPNGLEAMAALLKLAPGSKVIILSMYDDPATVEKAVRAGASGYLVKESAAEEIVTALRAVHGGASYLSPAIKPRVRIRRKNAPAELTEKEKVIVRLTTAGLRDKEIAARLKLSPHTVHVHRRNIFQKLGLHKQTELVRYAIKEGLDSL